MKQIIRLLIVANLAMFAFVGCNNNNNRTEAEQTIVALPPTVPATDTSTASPTSLPTSTSTATTPPTATATATHTLAPTETAVPTNTPSPTDTLTPTPTATLQATTPVTATLGTDSYEVPGQFTFQTVADYLVDPQANQAGIVSPDDEILLFMATQDAEDVSDLQVVLEGFIQATSADAGSIEPGDSYPYVVGGMEGLAVDVTGQFLGDDMSGRIVAIAPDNNRLFLAYGLAVNNRWSDEGDALFEETLATVTFIPLAVATPTTTAPTATAEPVSDFPLPIPSGTPAEEWQSLPIMPQAIAGADNNGSYSFTIATTPEAVQQFYEGAMGDLGWSLLSVGQGANEAFLMIFQQEGAVASISIFTLDENTTYVFLVR